MIALTTANTVVQPHSRLQSRALSTTDVPGGEDSSSFDITILPFAHVAPRTPTAQAATGRHDVRA